MLSENIRYPRLQLQPMGISFWHRPCRIWEIGKEDAKKEYPSVAAAAAAKEIGYKSATTVHTILKNNTHKKWRGEYIVE